MKLFMDFILTTPPAEHCQRWMHLTMYCDKSIWHCFQAILGKIVESGY